MIRLLGWLACRGSLGAARRWGRRLGHLLFGLGLRRAVAIDNIRRALKLDAVAARELARRAFAHLGVQIVEFLRIRSLDRARAWRLLGRAPLERLDGLRRQRGLLVLSAHLGNWDLLACAAAASGLPVNVITREIKTSWVNRFWMSERARCGLTLLPDRGSALAIRRALRAGEIVVLVLDQHQPGGVEVPFFDRPAATSTALARLARATGAPVVPAFLFRDLDGFRLELGDPISLAKSDDKAADLLANTAVFSAVIEEHVRKAPEQWFWVHRRWKVDQQGPADRSAAQGDDPSPPGPGCNGLE